MTTAEFPGHAEIINFAARTSQGGLSEAQRTHLGALVMLLGAGMRVHAALARQQPNDQARQDEFAVSLWQLAHESFASMLTEAKR